MIFLDNLVVKLPGSVGTDRGRPEVKTRNDRMN